MAIGVLQPMCVHPASSPDVHTHARARQENIAVCLQFGRSAKHGEVTRDQVRGYSYSSTQTL